MYNLKITTCLSLFDNRSFSPDTVTYTKSTSYGFFPTTFIIITDLQLTTLTAAAAAKTTLYYMLSSKYS